VDYSPKKVQLSVAGKLSTGLAEGSAITVEPAADDYEPKVGIQGDVGVAEIHNPIVMMKVRLLQTSKTNDDYNALRKKVFPVSLRDIGGTSVTQGKGRITKPASKVYSAGVEAQEWTFMIISEQHVVGGNGG
jgi:hypothetical protein